jgi:hypothetical protein
MPVADLQRFLLRRYKGVTTPEGCDGDRSADHTAAHDRRSCVHGVAYSLQIKKSEPVGMVVAGDRSLAFDVPVNVAPGPRFLSEFVRREGSTRRFVYIAIGKQTGDASSLSTISRRNCWRRRSVAASWRPVSQVEPRTAVLHPRRCGRWDLGE